MPTIGPSWTASHLCNIWFPQHGKDGVWLDIFSIPVFAALFVICEFRVCTASAGLLHAPNRIHMLRGAAWGCCAVAARLVRASSRGRKRGHAVRHEAFIPGRRPIIFRTTVRALFLLVAVAVVVSTCSQPVLTLLVFLYFYWQSVSLRLAS